MNKLCAIILINMVAVAVQNQQVEWHSFVPLVTTRTEVEANLGAPTAGKEFIFVYDTTDQRVTVWFGGAKTAKGEVCRWDVPNETVFKFVLAPKKVVRLSELRIDLTKFQRQKAPEMVQDYYYYNEIEGVTITTRMVEGEELLLNIERGPDSVQRKKFCCRRGNGC